MSKRSLVAPLDRLELDIIETLLAGHREWRPDLAYPESHSDMQAAVRALLQMFDVTRRNLPRQLEYACDTCCNRGKLRWCDDNEVWHEQPCPDCQRPRP